MNSIFFCICFFPVFLFSQNITQTVRGTVTDKTTNSPLIGASVIIPDSGKLTGSTTDMNGNFRIEKVSVGRVNIKITYIGYNEVILNNLNLSAGKEMVLDIQMEEKIITGKTVEIKGTADKSSTINKMTTVSSRSFTVEETERYAGSLNDVSRMAFNFAGVNGSNDSRNDIIIRGNSPSGLLWRLDGVDIPNPNHFASFGTTGGPISILNNTTLSNSDFMTGAFPAEYGNAVAGAFDLKMRNGNNEKHEFLGQIGFNGLEVGAEGPISKKNGSSYLINYRYSTLVLFDYLGMDFGANGIPYYQDVTFKFNFPKTKIGSFSVFGIGGLSDIELFDSKKDTSKEKLNFYGGEGFDITNSSDVGVAGLSHTYVFNNTTYSKLTIASTYHRFATLIDSISPADHGKTAWYRNDFNEYKWFASFFINKKINSRHNYKIGFLASDFNFDLTDSVYISSVNRFRTITNFHGSTYLIQPYLQWQFKPTDRLVFNAGVHSLYFTLNNTYSIEPRLGMKWNFTPLQTISLGYGMHGQTMPITVYFGQLEMPDGSYVRMNENLGLLGSQHLVLGYDLSINEFSRLKTETYFQYITNAAVNAHDKDEYSILNQGADFGVWSPDTLNNKGTGKNLGVEITLERFLKKGFYYLFTSSIYKSTYRGSNNIEHNTAFDGNYTFNLLAGKEFILLSKKNKAIMSLVFDIKTTYAGGKRYTPSYSELDPYTGFTQYRQMFEWEKAYSKKYKDYSRTDLKITFRRNGKKITQEWALHITNTFDQHNILTETFNKKNGNKSFSYQLGRMFIPLYRITF
ncbi:MAG: TonB-dependent receptor [Bacteroidales bacterium]